MPTRSASRSTASTNPMTSIFCTNAIASPRSAQPKQWNVPWLGAHVERRRLLVVERAQALLRARPRGAQRDVLARPPRRCGRGRGPRRCRCPGCVLPRVKSRTPAGAPRPAPAPPRRHHDGRADAVGSGGLRDGGRRGGVCRACRRRVAAGRSIGAGVGGRRAGRPARQGPRTEDRLQPRPVRPGVGRHRPQRLRPAQPRARPGPHRRGQAGAACVVLAGTLHDPYTGATVAFTRGPGTSERVQIDHVVALSDAWQTGAQALDAGTRETDRHRPAQPARRRRAAPTSPRATATPPPGCRPPRTSAARTSRGRWR